jgi:ribosomal protein S15P/S13E
MEGREMIALKDIPMLVGLAGSVVTGTVFVHDLRRDVAELGADYRQHVAEQQEVSLTEKRWKLESRVEAHPDDVGAKRELQEVNRLLDKNQKQQEQLKGGK